METAKRDKDVLVVFLFDSFAKGKGFRDVDICLVFAKNFPI